MNLREKQLIVVGVEHIGTILLQRLLNAGIPADNLSVCDSDVDKIHAAAEHYGIRPAKLTGEAVCEADAVLLAVCGPVGDCNAVQSNPYARLFGILPIGVLGPAGYLAILAAWLYHRFQRNRMSSYMPGIIFGFTTFGVLFSLYLTVLEPFVIHAVCIWCITSAAIMTLLLLLSIQPALQAMKNLQEADHPHANDEIESTSQ